MNKLIENVLANEFECIAGPLEKSNDFKKLCESLPKYPLGTAVDVNLKVTVDEENFSKWVPGNITKVCTEFTEKGAICHRYTVSAGVPQEYFRPKEITSRSYECDIRHRGVQKDP